jgi:hypothetical protein
LHPRGDQLEQTGAYKWADGKAVSVYLAAAWSSVQLCARATMAVSALFWTEVAL